MMSKLPEILAGYEGTGYVVAPAGFGKTHLIAESTALSSGRQLVLTHTHTGVSALRRKMSSLGVSSKLCHIDTIASWALRLCLAYSKTSEWEIERPVDNDQWDSLNCACARLLDHGFIRRIVRASYVGLYVDEYQDCSMSQHEIVLKMARDLPCRILGDPLQGIFDFSGQRTIDWRRDVESRFEELGQLTEPHRWKNAGAVGLGNWLTHIRSCLEAGQPVNLEQGLPAEVRFVKGDSNPQGFFKIQANTCRYKNCERSDTVIAIHKGSQEYKAKCHVLSKNLSGKFTSIEEIEGKELFSFIGKVEAAETKADSLKAVIDFSKKCMSKIEVNLPAGTRRGEQVKIRDTTKNQAVAESANVYLSGATSAAMLDFFVALRNLNEVKVIREDLLNRMLGVLRKHVLNPSISLGEAAEKYHSEFRFKGRPVGRRRLIGTTLLVKGLEFDHAIVLDAASLSKKELYVALTRGARSLTIISTSTRLNPAG